MVRATSRHRFHRFNRDEFMRTLDGRFNERGLDQMESCKCTLSVPWKFTRRVN